MIGLLLTALLGMAAGAETKFSDLPKIEYFRNPYLKSEGYQLGFVLDFAREGIAIWSYEGNFMVGYGSAPEEMIDHHCYESKTHWLSNIKDEARKQKAMDAARKECFVFKNPWLFSTLNSRIFKQYEDSSNMKATPVLIYYSTPTISI